MAVTTIKDLRRHAIAQSLFAPLSLQGAIDQLGFVQADPIRSPARAQDLILRHRVHGYRVGDLDREYATLDVEEDYLYAYGFVARRVWNLLHPRKAKTPRLLERKVLAVVRELGEAHPTALAPHLGSRRMVNAWGGYSKATTNALEWLQWRGFLRVVRRENGIRVYQPAPQVSVGVDASERLRELVRVLVTIFAPVPEKSLRTLIAAHRDLGNPRETLADLMKTGELRREVVDGHAYVWCEAGSKAPDNTADTVRFLAPFDPLVWDRRRFEHLWGWQYRFEAYTPPAKRLRGYYAMPLLWRDTAPGWANAQVKDGKLQVEVGFVTNRPRGREFTRALDEEIDRLSISLGVTKN